jgi:translocation and assembly module TamB
MTWKERLIGLPLALVGAALLLATVAGMMLTRTDWGREKVRGYAVEKLNAAIRGRVEIDEVLEGDLLRMVSMAGVRVYEEDGRKFADVDTLRVHYRWSDFLFGNLTFAQVTFVNPVVQLRTEPGIGWNFEEAFRSPHSRDAVDGREDDGGGLRLELRDVAIRSGDVTMLIPWDHEPGGDPDSVRWHVLEAYGEWWRELRFERLNSRLTVARVIAPRNVSRLFQVVQFTTRATIVDDPFEVQQLRADIEVIGNKLSFDVWEGDLAASTLFGQGWVILESDPDYDFTMRGNPMSTSDIQWLLPWMPNGEADLDFHMRTLPDGIALEAQNARWESRDARATGRFAMSLRDRPDGLAFDALDVDVDRLHTSLISDLAGWDSPVPAQLTGRVALDGPLSELAVDADLSVLPEGAVQPTRVTGIGTMHAHHVWRGELGAQDLRLEFDTVRLDLVRALVPEMAVDGDVTGWAHFDGRLAEGVEVEFELEQRDGGLTPTRLGGAGTVATDTSGMVFDMDVRGDEVSFNTLSQYYPAILFRGDFAGSMHARGPLRALQVEALLAGVGDSIRLDGEIRLADQEIAYDGVMEGRRMRVVPFREGLPESDIDFRAELTGRGLDLSEMEARGHLDVFSSFVGGVRLDTAYADLRIVDGRLMVDSGAAVAEFGEIRLAGGIGLLPDSAARLAFDIAADSLGGLTPWVFPGYSRLTGPSLTTGASGETEQAGVAAQVEGSAHISGALDGVVGDVAFRADMQGAGLRYGLWAADSLLVEDFEIAGLPDSLYLVGTVTALGASAGDVRLESVGFRGNIAEGMAAIDFELVADSTSSASGRVRIGVDSEPRTLAIDSLEIQLEGTHWTLDRPGLVRVASSGAFNLGDIRVSSDAGRLAALGFIEESGPASLTAEATGVDLAAIAGLWPDDIDLAGRLTASAEVLGTTELPVIRAAFEAVDGRLVGVPFTSLRGVVEYEDGDAAIDISMWDGESALFRLHGTYPVDLTLPTFAVDIPDRQIRLTLEGDSIPLNLATLFFGNQIAEPHGHAFGTVSIGGTPGNLNLEGPAVLVDGGFRVIYSGITYRNLNGDAFFRGQNLELSNLSLSGVPLRRNASGGRADLRGTMNLSNLRNPGFDLTLTGEELPLYDQLDARFIVTGVTRLIGRYEAPVVTGNLAVISGVLYMDEIGRQAEIIDPYEEGFVLIDSLFGIDGSGSRRSNPFLDNLTLDVNVDVQYDTWLRSAEANVAIAGNLLINMRPGQDEWRIDGTLQALRGDYRLFNKRFEVSEGTIEFVGIPAMNPNLRIVALYNLRTQKKPIEIQLIIGGTLEEMTLALASDAEPPIPESDLLSYLMFGRPSYEITRSSEERSLLTDVAADVPQAFLGYALGSLLVGETGLAYIDVSRVNYWGGAESTEYQQGVGPSFGATQVEVGWYLAPTVFVSVAQHLAGAVRPTVRLEWKLDEKLTLRGVTQPRFGEAGRLVFEVPGADIQQSIGVFLFYGWNY